MTSVSSSGKPPLEILSTDGPPCLEPCALTKSNITTLDSTDENRNPLVMVSQGKNDHVANEGGYLLLRPLGMKLHIHQESSWSDSDKVTRLFQIKYQVGGPGLHETPRHPSLRSLGSLRIHSFPSGQLALWTELNIYLKNVISET